MDYYHNYSIFDYIVIGTGPSGAVIAKSLTDNPMVSVLSLEAGDNNTEELPIQTPSNQTWRYFPYYFWQGRSIGQEHVNRKMFNWTTGRLLGGGSSVNGGQYVRPTASVLRKWEELLGPIWSPFRATELFKQLENYNGQTDNPEARGYHGPIDIRQAPQNVPMLTKKLVDSIALGTGYPVILDYNNPNTPIGPFYRWQLYQTPNGRRLSSANAFLSQDIMTPDGYGVNGRKLRVLMESTATRILFNQNMEAVGIEYLEDGYCKTAYANKKVIISAGINSAQLLMLSGIGDEQMLMNFGVPALIHNPYVGKNLVNHIINTATFSVNQADLPELQNDPNALYTGGAFLPYPHMNHNDDRSIQMFGEINRGVLTLSIIDLFPKSRGSIQIQNNDPLKIVLADYNYFSNPEDVETIKSVYRNYIVPIANTLSSIDPAYQLISPSLDIINNDNLLENFIRINTLGTYHEQSFNRMAPVTNGGVVDNTGSVYGVHNLIVSDSSIIPFTVDGNNSAASYLIGDTIAHLLMNES